jgi:hypothetical protein
MPLGAYERTLRRERNYQAEHAMKELTDLIVKAAVEKGHSSRSKTSSSAAPIMRSLKRDRMLTI